MMNPRDEEYDYLFKGTFSAFSDPLYQFSFSEKLLVDKYLPVIHYTSVIENVKDPNLNKVFIPMLDLNSVLFLVYFYVYLICPQANYTIVVCIFYNNTNTGYDN